jgi:hypothetical protein
MDVVKGLAALAAFFFLWAAGTVAAGAYFGIIGAIALEVIRWLT